MKHNSNDEDSDLRLFNSNDDPNNRFGRKDLYLVLLAFAIGITVDYWFNTHQLTSIASSRGAISTPAPVKSKNTAQTSIINLLL